MIDHNYLYLEPLKEKDTVLILGATKGDFMREYKDEILRKDVLVVNVEPTLEGISELTAWGKVFLPKNCMIISCALSDKRGFTSMDIRANLITSTLEERQETNQRWPMPLLYKTRVPVFTFDDVLDVIGKVDKVFCDIEGSELEVFGASKRLNEISYYAIAAYHMRDGKETWNNLQEIFEGFDIEVTGEPSYHKNEVVFFARRS